MQRIWFTPIPYIYFILIYNRADDVAAKKVMSLIGSAVTHLTNLSHVIIFVAPWKVFDSAEISRPAAKSTQLVLEFLEFRFPAQSESENACMFSLSPEYLIPTCGVQLRYVNTRTTAWHALKLVDTQCLANIPT